MKKKIIIGLYILIIIIVSLVAIIFSGVLNDKEDVDEEWYDVDISISTDKTEYAVDEEVNITLIIKNNMEKYFPFGDYSLKLVSVIKTEYDSRGIMTKSSISKLFVDSINVSAGDTFTESILWEPNNRNIEPGDYYILFEISRPFTGGGGYSIKDVVSKEITFI